MEVKATARYLRISPRKMRPVIDVVRGLDLASARQQLRFMKKAAAPLVLKLIDSAAANARHNFQLSIEQLFVKRIAADGGPVIHRSTPKAFGRAAPIRKRMTPLSVTLEDRKKEDETEKGKGKKRQKST